MDVGASVAVGGRGRAGTVREALGTVKQGARNRKRGLGTVKQGLEP